MFIISKFTKSTILYIAILVIVMIAPFKAICFPNIYLVGAMNNWEKSEDWKFTTTDGDKYTLENVRIYEDQEFRLLEASDSGDIIYGLEDDGWGQII